MATVPYAWSEAMFVIGVQQRNHLFNLKCVICYTEPNENGLRDAGHRSRLS